MNLSCKRDRHILGKAEGLQANNFIEKNLHLITKTNYQLKVIINSDHGDIILNIHGHNIFPCSDTASFNIYSSVIGNVNIYDVVIGRFILWLNI